MNKTQLNYLIVLALKNFKKLFLIVKVFNNKKIIRIKMNIYNKIKASIQIIYKNSFLIFLYKITMKN